MVGKTLPGVGTARLGEATIVGGWMTPTIVDSTFFNVHIYFVHIIYIYKYNI